MKRIVFENYKAFAKGEIELRPLTLLLGANSSGKSSILHLLLMLKQTINNAENYANALKTNGHSINLGEDVNLLKDRNRSNPFILEFSVDPNRFLGDLIKKHREMLKDYAIKYLTYISSLSPDFFNSETDRLERFMKDESTSTSTLFVYRNLLMHFDNDHQESFQGGFWGNTGSIEDLRKIIGSMIHCITDFLHTFSEKADKASIRFEFRLGKTSRKLRVRSCHVKINDKSLVRFSTNNNITTIESDVYDSESLGYLHYMFHPKLSFNGLGIKTKNTDVFSTFIVSVVGQAFAPIQSYFSEQNLKYVGPLRAIPQRYYFLDESNINQGLDSQNGSSLAEILKMNTTVKKQINKWMELFELTVDVKEFKDVIHNIKVTHNGLVLDIPDVGFGVSQVLPILVEGLMAPQDSTIIMEQPEIHLHPKMQAQLADYFIDMLNLQSKDQSRISKNLIIETHSEYILKRIRRRIAEGKISPKHVGVYFVKPRSSDNPDSAQIEMASFSGDGSIEWPRDFYITEWEDDMAYFKSKINKS